MAKKYIDAEKLIDIIEKLESTFKKLEKTIGREDFFKGKREMAVQTRSIVKSLQQEQLDVDLENEIHRYFNPHGMALQFDRSKGNTILNPEQLINFARHFYELGFNARKEKSR